MARSLIRQSWLSRFVWLLAIATPLMLFNGCANPSTTPDAETEASTPTQPQTQQNVKFTLSWLLQGVDAPLTTAIEKGYFSDKGLNVSFERGYGSADSISKIAAGQYDMGFGDIYSMIEFNEKNPDQRLVAVAVPYNKAPFVIISLKETGINSPQDLAGKKLGAPAGDAPRRLFPIFAEQVGIDPNSVNWTTMEPRLREALLLQKEVDAVSAFLYSSLPPLVKGGADLNDLNVFFYTDNGLDFYGNAIIAKAAFVEENPEVVRAFVAAYVQGLQDTLRDPAAALETVLSASDQPIDATAEKLRLQIALRLWVNEEVERDGLLAIDPARFETTIAQTVQGFGLTTTPTVEEVFDASFLPPKEERALPPASERGVLE